MPPRRLHRLLLLLALGGTTPAIPVHAQADAAAVLHRHVESLGDSARVRLLAPGVVVSDGVFLGFTHDSLRVSEADAVLHVGIDELEGLSVRGSKWLGMGIATGAVAAIAGATAGFFFGSRDCGLELAGCEARAGRVSLRWGLVFGTTGALIGALAGSRIQRWRVVFP